MSGNGFIQPLAAPHDGLKLSLGDPRAVIAHLNKSTDRGPSCGDRNFITSPFRSVVDQVPQQFCQSEFVKRAHGVRCDIHRPRHVIATDASLKGLHQFSQNGFSLALHYLPAHLIARSCQFSFHQMLCAGDLIVDLVGNGRHIATRPKVLCKRAHHREGGFQAVGQCAGARTRSFDGLFLALKKIVHFFNKWCDLSRAIR